MKKNSIEKFHCFSFFNVSTDFSAHNMSTNQAPQDFTSAFQWLFNNESANVSPVEAPTSEVSNLPTDLIEVHFWDWINPLLDSELDGFGLPPSPQQQQDDPRPQVKFNKQVAVVSADENVSYEELNDDYRGDMRSPSEITTGSVCSFSSTPVFNDSVHKLAEQVIGLSSLLDVLSLQVEKLTEEIHGLAERLKTTRKDASTQTVGLEKNLEEQCPAGTASNSTEDDDNDEDSDNNSLNLQDWFNYC